MKSDLRHEVQDAKAVGVVMPAAIVPMEVMRRHGFTPRLNTYHLPERRDAWIRP